MAQLADFQSTQNKLEECFSKRMMELEAQLQTGGSTKETVAKVAEEFRTFRELIFNMLRLLRQQIAECTRTIDSMETRHRQKALLFLGVEEGAPDCVTAVLNIVHNTLGLKDVSVANLTSCHRIGSSDKGHNRPILVKFSDRGLRASVWKVKSKLKGSSISLREFLTRTRQLIFARARQHFGMRACWTQDGVINVKIGDGNRSKITSAVELDILIQKYPKANASSACVSGDGTAAKSSSNPRTRKL